MNLYECCGDQVGYNTYRNMRGMGYNVLYYLMENNEEIWKLLKYNTPDALSKPNLTMKEKADLVWDGTGDSEEYRVFRGAYLDDAFIDQSSQLRIYVTVLNPDNRTVGTVDIGIEILVHNKIINLDTYETRQEVLLQQVLETLNGKEIGGVGKLFFDRNGSLYDIARLNLYNNRNIYGYTLIMSTKSSNTREGC